MADAHNKISINILPVKNGDCLHLRFYSSGEWKNIVIDSGPASASGTFRTLLEQIQAHDEYIDLLCFSHIDDDHIKAAERILSTDGFDATRIRSVWINLPPNSSPAGSTDSTYRPETVSTACGLWDAIYRHNIPCLTHIEAGTETYIGNALIHAVLPTQERLISFYNEWDKQNKQLNYHPVSPQQDTSPFNGSSITLLCTIEDEKILLCGDAFSSDLTVVGQQYGGVTGFTLVKLPHHGSDANITSQMISSLNCTNFIISGRETLHRPSPATMDILDSYGATVNNLTVYGNYQWPRFSSGFSNLKIVFPDTNIVLLNEKIEVCADASSTKPFAQ